MATIVHSILNPTKPQPSATVPQAPNPMTMDIDNLRIQINALQQQLRNRGSGHGSGFRTLPRPTDAQRARLRQRGACFRCRRDGHHVRDCQMPQNSLSVSYQAVKPEA
ncbi:hypothetical protein BGX26_006963 [Mortierella sp. AD094]|nr:hypothetical protein BGX26_006963 [Mortierella sp. AD094]